MLRLQRTTRGLSWAVALVVGAGGLGLFAIALMGALRHKTEDNSALEAEIRQLDDSCAKSDSELNKLRLADKPKADELALKREENVHAATRIAERTVHVKDIEEENRKKIDVAQRQLQEADEKTRQEIKDANITLQKNAADQEKQKQLQKFLGTVEDTIVTIACGNGDLATGVILGGFNRPLIVTADAKSLRNTELALHLHYRLPGVAAPKVGTGRARLIYEDTESGLAFLSFEFTGRITLTGLSLDHTSDAKIGDKVYAIGTQVLGDELLEFNVFDGSISATRAAGARTMFQVGLAANAGTRGSPLVNGDGNMVGILVEQLEGLEKTSVAIPAKYIGEAVRRLQQRQR